MAAGYVAIAIYGVLRAVLTSRPRGLGPGDRSSGAKPAGPVSGESLHAGLRTEAVLDLGSEQQPLPHGARLSTRGYLPTANPG